VVLDHDVLALDVSSFGEGFTKCSAKARGALGRPTADEADHRHRLLLRARRDRPRSRRAAQQRDKLAAQYRHSMTSSAMASSDGGT
jgi:hypothetical protein